MSGRLVVLSLFFLFFVFCFFHFWGGKVRGWMFGGVRSGRWGVWWWEVGGGRLEVMVMVMVMVMVIVIATLLPQNPFILILTTLFHLSSSFLLFSLASIALSTLPLFHIHTSSTLKTTFSFLFFSFFLSFFHSFILSLIEWIE